MKCTRCEKEVNRIKHLHRVKKEFLCYDCYSKNRILNRKKLIESDLELKKDLKEYDKKLHEEYLSQNEVRERIRNKAREDYHKRNPNAVSYKSNIPLPLINIKRAKSNSYITLQEKQNLFNILIHRGLSPEEADERIKTLIGKQKELREELKLQKKSEAEIKLKQQQLLNELYTCEWLL